MYTTDSSWFTSDSSWFAGVHGHLPETPRGRRWLPRQRGATPVAAGGRGSSHRIRAPQGCHYVLKPKGILFAQGPPAVFPPIAIHFFWVEGFGQRGLPLVAVGGCGFPHRLRPPQGCLVTPLLLVPPGTVFCYRFLERWYTLHRHLFDPQKGLGCSSPAPLTNPDPLLPC